MEKKCVRVKIFQETCSGEDTSTSSLLFRETPRIGSSAEIIKFHKNTKSVAGVQGEESTEILEAKTG